VQPNEYFNIEYECLNGGFSGEIKIKRDSKQRF
jgi:hypothetical protein